MRNAIAMLFILVALLVFAATAYAIGILSTSLDAPIKAARVRLLSLIGFFVIAALVLLGAVWPSYYSIVAVVMVLPLLLLAAIIVRPAVLEGRSGLRLCLVIAVAISALCWVFEAIWLAR